jgi:hypothetical protein
MKLYWNTNILFIDSKAIMYTHTVFYLEVTPFHTL